MPPLFTVVIVVNPGLFEKLNWQAVVNAVYADISIELKLHPETLKFPIVPELISGQGSKYL